MANKVIREKAKCLYSTSIVEQKAYIHGSEDGFQNGYDNGYIDGYADGLKIEQIPSSDMINKIINLYKKFNDTPEIEGFGTIENYIKNYLYNTL